MTELYRCNKCGKTMRDYVSQLDYDNALIHSLHFCENCTKEIEKFVRREAKE